MTDQFEHMLNQFWDDFVERQPSPTELDAQSAQAITELHSFNTAPLPGSARERARQRIFTSDAPSQESDMSTLVLTPPAVNGHFVISSPIPIPRVPSAPKSPLLSRRALISLAAAVLIAFAGLGGYFAEQRLFSDDPTSVPLVIPAPQTTPTGDWPMYRGDAGRTGYSSVPGPVASPDVLWQFDAGASAFRSPAVAGGVAFLGDASGTVTAIDTATGDVLWTFAGDSSLEVTPAVVDGMVYIPSLVGTLHAIDTASGEERWRFANALGEFATPTHADGILFAGSQADGHLYAIDAETGEEVWSFDTGAPILRGTAYADGVVYTPADNGSIYAIDSSDGTSLWSYSAGDGSFGTPSVGDGIVAAAGPDGLYVFDAKTGELRFTFANPSGEGMTPATIADGTLYVGGWDGSIYAVDANDGALLWSVPTGEMIRANPIVGGNVVYAANTAGVLVAADTTSHTVLWEYQLDGSVDFGPSLADGMLYVSTDTGTLYALGESGDAVATPVGPLPESTPESASGFDPSQVNLIWSTSGSEESSLSVPTGLAIAPNGNIYVVNGMRNTIEVFSPAGDHLDTWGEEGQDPGQFQFTKGDWVNGDIGFDADGNIYVFDTYNDRIQKFAPDHTFLLEWGSRGSENGQFIDAQGGVDAANGLVYVADSNNRVQVFDLEGNYLDKWGNTGSEPGQFRIPLDVFVNSQGMVYVGEDQPGRVQMFDSSGRFLNMTGAGGTLEANSGIVVALTVDSNDNLFIGDWSKSLFWILNPAGELIGIIDEIPGIEIGQPCGIAVDHDGFLYFTDCDASLYKVAIPSLDA